MKFYHLSKYPADFFFKKRFFSKNTLCAKQYTGLRSFPQTRACKRE